MTGSEKDGLVQEAVGRIKKVAEIGEVDVDLERSLHST